MRLSNELPATGVVLAGGVAVDGNDVNAINTGGRLLVLPYAAYNVDGRTTGYVVRNVSGASLTGNA